MKKLNKYTVIYAKHTYINSEIEADNQEDANYIAKLKAPAGYEPIHTEETTESIIQRVCNNENTNIA